MIQDKLCQQIANKVVELIKEYKIVPYNEKNQTGTIRHIIIRIGKNTNQVMLTMVTNEEKIDNEELLVADITKEFKQIKTVIKNINSQNTNVILGKRSIVLYGNGYIEDYLGEYKFEISTEKVCFLHILHKNY